MGFFPDFFHRDKPKEDLYIAVLRWGREHLGEYTTPKDLFDLMNDRGFESPYLSNFVAFQRLFWDTFTALDHPEEPYYERFEWVLSVESYFRLLEYEELNEARQSSTKALRLAVAAMIIAAGLAIASIIIAVGSSD